MTFDRRRANAFVRDHWRGLASAGWNAYVEHGRGAVVIDWDVVDHQIDAFETMYGADADDPGIQQLIASYDPKTSVVIAFTSRARGVVAAFVVSDLPAPYEAAVVTTH